MKSRDKWLFLEATDINYQQLLDQHPEYLNFLSVKEKITLSEKTLVTANSHSSTKDNVKF